MLLSVCLSARTGPPKIRAGRPRSIKTQARRSGPKVTMEPVQKYVRDLLQTEKYGGRVIMRDEHTLILYDTPGWGDRQAQLVRARFPECEVSCLAHAQSMSGFIVVIRRHAHLKASLWASLFILALAGVAYTSIVLRKGLSEEGL